MATIIVSVGPFAGCQRAGGDVRTGQADWLNYRECTVVRPWSVPLPPDKSAEFFRNLGGTAV